MWIAYVFIFLLYLMVAALNLPWPIFKDLVIRFNWTAAGVLISLAISVITLKTTSTHRHQDNQNKSSEFYLTQTKIYFSDAVTLLQNAKNNNIKWHQAINLLTHADRLFKQLTEQQHKNIYVLDFINSSYTIIDIINKIDDFKFFYGVENYKDFKSTKSLYDESCPEPFNNKSSCISTKELSWLCRFLDKAGLASYDLDESGIPLDKISIQDYFQKSVRTELLQQEEVSKRTRANVQVILDYLNDFKIRQDRAEIWS